MKTTKKATLSASQIETLRASFATTPDRISFDHADRLLALMDQCDEATMRALAAADIKFVSNVAKGRLLRARRNG